ncbi:MAG: glycosyltransferase [Desulfobulbus propionicus]|nr:MAG: glycosyltransferase [Desulfobulbus propionicus]
MTQCCIIIVNWNSWDYLWKCLDALSTQTYKDFKVFVIDNASNNQEKSVYLKKFSWVEYIENKSNIGFAAANNNVINTIALSPWVVLLNPDTVPDCCWLESLMAAAKAYPEYSSFGSKLLKADEPSLLDGEGDVYHMSGFAWRKGHGQPANTLTTEYPIFSPCAAAAMYDRKAFQLVGGFDTDYFCYHEDVDLGFRLQLAGFRALQVPSSVVFHHGSATTSTRSDFSLYYGHRNLIWTWFKNLPLPFLLLFFPIHCLWNIAALCRYIFRGQGKVVGKAKIDGYFSLKKVLKKRSDIQKNRSVSLLFIWSIIDKRLVPRDFTKIFQHKLFLKNIKAR